MNIEKMVSYSRFRLLIRLRDGISAVYNFYDPDPDFKRSGYFHDIVTHTGDNKAEQKISLPRVLDKRVQEDEL